MSRSAALCHFDPQVPHHVEMNRSSHEQLDLAFSSKQPVTMADAWPVHRMGLAGKRYKH
jgi:hypothetical protein